MLFYALLFLMSPFMTQLCRHAEREAVLLPSAKSLRQDPAHSGITGAVAPLARGLQGAEPVAAPVQVHLHQCLE